MDNAISALLSVNFVFFCLMIAGITWILRNLAEHLFRKYNVAEHSIWREVILPGLPVVLGMLVALFATKYPYGMPVAYVSFRVVYGTAAGLLSATVFRAIRAWIKNFIKSKTSSSDPSSQSESSPPESAKPESKSQ